MSSSSPIPKFSGKVWEKLRKQYLYRLCLYTGSVVCVVNKLRSGWFGFRSRAGAKIFFSSKSFFVSGVHPVFCLVGSGILFRWYSGGGVRLTTRFYLAPRLGISGDIPICLHGVDGDNFSFLPFVYAVTRVSCPEQYSIYDFLPPKWKGYAVAQLVEALRYKPEGRRFDFRWSHWNCSLT
jgi:hypothetical protein